MDLRIIIPLKLVAIWAGLFVVITVLKNLTQGRHISDGTGDLRIILSPEPAILALLLLGGGWALVKVVQMFTPR